jgi:hypothetical protein
MPGSDRFRFGSGRFRLASFSFRLGSHMVVHFRFRYIGSELELEQLRWSILIRQLQTGFR